jgi:hypothetical protein
MSQFFSKLSSKVSNLLSPGVKNNVSVPEVEDWAGWCKDVANFHKEQADLRLDWVPLREIKVSLYEEWDHVSQDRVKLYKEYPWC